MANRFCHRCGSDVEDAGGFCLLGHRFVATFDPPPPPPPPPPAMDDLTAEVGRVFDEAQATVQALATSELPADAAPERPSRYATSLDRTWAQLESAPPPSADDPINTFAPPPRMDWGPQRATSRFRLRRQRVEASV